MPLTPEEIDRRAADIREEIAVRERLLEAYAALRAQLEQRENAMPSPTSQRVHPSPPNPAVSAPEASPLANVETPPPSEPDGPCLPESLTRMKHGRTGRIVAWAIQQMTEDYTLRDIQAFLSQHGAAQSSAEISVVLSRMKVRGEIQEVKRGGGRRAAIFRKPDIAPPQTNETGAAPSNAGDAMKETTRET